MSIRTPGSHWQGPLLGSDRAVKGLFEDTTLGIVDRFRSPYKEFYTDFNGVVDIATMADIGWTETAVGTAASRSVSYNVRTGTLLVNADTVALEGTNLQNNAAPASPATSVPYSNLPGPITSTATLMDNREMIWSTRVTPVIAAGTWTSKFLIGWFVTDTALMTPSTGALAIASGGGLGFHVAESGALTAVVQGTTSATQFATGYSLASLVPVAPQSSVDQFDLGFRCRWIDASAGTGVVQFFVNGNKVVEVNGANTPLPMQSTQVYSNSIEVINGPATANQVDLHIEYLYNAFSRIGLTYPYSAGLNL